MFSNIGFFGILLSLVPIILPLAIFIFLIIYVMRIVKRTERRADERLTLDKEYTAMQQQQMQAITELNTRLTRIENTLKEVE